MTETITRLVGVSLAGKYTLEKFLGGGDRDAYFLTRIPDGQRAVVEIVPADDPAGEQRARAWRLAAGIPHQNLIKILDVGRERAAGSELAWLVMEVPDDDLGRVLVDRPLTEAEARDVLRSAVAGLTWIHRHGLVHGEVEPGNIAAIEDKVKLSSNTLRTAGQGGASPEDDIRALGRALYEMLTARHDAGTAALETLPEPFRSIVRGCMAPGSEQWSLERVAAALDPPAATATMAEPVVVPPRPAATPPPGPAAEPRRAVTAQEPAAAHPTSAGRRRTPVWIFVAALALVALVIVISRKSAGPEQATPPPVTAPAVNPAEAIPPATPEPEMRAKPAPSARRAPPPAPVPEARRETGAGNETRIWRVVAYTFSRQRDAVRRVESINRKWPELKAEVFSIRGNNPPYLVSLGGRMTHSEALRVQRTAVAHGLPRDTFMRNFSR